MAGDDSFYPGVQVIERPFQQSKNNLVGSKAVGTFIGKSNKGPTTPTLVTSWSDFVARYGSDYTDLHPAVNDAFANNGGAPVYVQRIVGTSAATATASIYANDAPQDPQNPGQVLPGTTPLFTFETTNPGAWGNNLKVVIGARDPSNKRFDITVFLVPSTVVFDPSKRNSEYMTDQFVDVSLDPADANYLYDVVNLPNTTGSHNVVVSGQSYSASTPSIRPYPSVTGYTSFSGGADGSYTSVTYDNSVAYQAAIDLITQIDGQLILNLPNVTAGDIIRYAVQTAATRGDIFVVIDPPANKTSIDMVSYVTSDLALGSLGTSTPSYGAVYYPRLYLPQLGASKAGKVALRSPGGAVVGAMMSTDSAFGPFRSPAGRDVRVAGAIDTEIALIDADLTRLNNNHVNVIRSIQGVGIAIMGGRTLKLSGDDRYVNVRRSAIYLHDRLRRLAEFAPFRNNDQRLWNDIIATFDRELTSYWNEGGLAGSTKQEAFYIKCDSTNNTPGTVSAGYLYVEVGVAYVKPAEFVIISLGQYDGTTTVSSNL